MQSCNIATGAIYNYTNTIASVPTSEISRSGVGVSQHYSALTAALRLIPLLLPESDPH